MMFVNTQNDQFDWFDLTAYFEGSTSREQRDELERWIADQPERAEMLRRYRAVWESRQQPVVPVYDREAVKAAVQQSLRAHATAPVRRRSLWSLRATGIAAVASVIAILMFFGGRDTLHIFETQRSEQYSTYTTLNGERARITLPDGTGIILSVASRLQIPADYSAGNRTVRLDGEAFFSVASRTDAPFIVVAGPSTTRVLGTEFVVRHYETDSLATVTVRSGRVSVGASIVGAMQQVSVGKDSIAKVQSSDLRVFAFTNGIMTLPSTTLGEAISDLNRWYGADIRIADPAIRRLHVEGDFLAGSTSDLAQHLELGFDLRVLRQGRILTLLPK